MQKTVLIVEDELLIALDLKLLFEDHGWRVVGPVATVRDALQLINEKLPSIALLDVNLGNERVTLVAETLKARDVPFVVASAYDNPERFGGEVLAGIIVASAYDNPERFGGEVLAGIPNVGKPIDERRLFALFAQLIAV